MRAAAALLFVVTPVAVHAGGVAFVGVEGLGLERATVQPIERILERAIADEVGAGLLSPDEVTARLLDPAVERLRHCNGNVDCLVDLGGILELDLVVYATLTRLGENFVIVLKSIDVSLAGESNRIRHELSGGEDQLVEAARAAAHQLLQPAGFRGSIVFEELPVSAQVAIDGEAVGAFEGEPLEVAPGRHAVTITTAEGGSRSLLIDVARGELTRVDARRAVTVESRPARHDLVSQWWPIGAAGLGAALLVTGTTLGGLTLAEQSSFEEGFRTRSMDADELRASYERGRSFARAANITLGLGAALAGIGAGAWLLQGDPPSAFDAILIEWREPLLLGIGGASLATGVTLGILTAREESGFEDSFRHDPGNAAALRDSLNRGRSFALWTNILLTAGLALTGAGLADLLLID